MFKNYFILNRLILELNKKLSGYKIIRAFTFEKDRIILILKMDENVKAIEISVNPGFPYLTLKNKFSIPKKNLVDFFSPHFPMKIHSFEIAEKDRIIRIKTNKAAFYFVLRGKFTNLYLINNETESFKKIDIKIIEDFTLEVNNLKFISDFNDLKISNDFLDKAAISDKYPFIGKEIINEANLRGNDPDKISKNILTEIINEIKEKKPAVFIDEPSGKVNLGVESFGIFTFTKKEIFNELTDAFNHFLAGKMSFENIETKKKIIEKHIERELKKISMKLNEVKAQIQKGSKEEEYKKKANLLLINLKNIPKGNDKIELPDLYEKSTIVNIKLDSRLSPKQNVDSYFLKARNERIRSEKMKKLFSDLNDKYTKIKKIKDRFLTADSSMELNVIIKELNIKKEKKKKDEDDIRSKFRHFIIQDKYNVYVGKDSKSNDLLTMKFAKKNDYWFHARSVSGSHVILKNDNPKEGIPKNILKLTASIAAFYSKAKTSGMVPVSFTQKKYVSKKKGMEPGKVALLRENVLIVKPEIAEGIKYGSDN